MSKKITVPLVLFLALIILIIIGRYVYQWQAVSPSPTSSSTIPTQVAKPTTASNSSAPSTGDQAIAACESNLGAQVKSQNTQYAQGSILVGFKTTVTFSQASTVLSGYGLSVQDSTSAASSFSSSHILTATVPSGNEIKNICILKQDPSVRSAALNVIFSLHE